MTISETNHAIVDQYKNTETGETVIVCRCGECYEEQNPRLAVVLMDQHLAEERQRQIYD